MCGFEQHPIPLPDGYQLAFAHYEETPEGTYGLARYDTAGGPEAGGTSITVIGRPTPMWPATLERPVVSDTGPFVLRDASQLEGGSDNYRSVGFEVAGCNYITVDSDGTDALSFEQLAALADGLSQPARHTNQDRSNPNSPGSSTGSSTAMTG